MFAPVVDSLHRARRDRPLAQRRARRCARWPRARSTSRSRPTCCRAEAAADAPGRAGADRAALPRRRPRSPATPSAPSSRAQRPLSGPGRGARARGRQVGDLALRARRAGPDDLRRPWRCSAARAPVRRRHAAARRAGRPAVGRGRRRPRRSAADLDGMNTQNWAMPQPPMLIAVNSDPVDAAKNYRPDLILEDLDALDAAPARPRRRSTPSPPGCAPSARRPARRLDARALRFLDAVSFAVPDDAVLVCDMCIPGYWIAGFHGFARPRGPAVPDGLGHAGLRVPGRAGRRAGRRRPRRVDLAATAASCSRRASWRRWPRRRSR